MPAYPSLGGIGMPRTTTGRATFVAVSIAAIWLSTLAASLFAPSLITGSAHETIPLVAAVDWLWAALATGFVVLAAGLVREGHGSSWFGAAIAVSAIWLAVALASVAGPSLVTGTDPTTIPLAAILSPLAGVIGTAYVAIFAAALGAAPVDQTSPVGHQDPVPTPIAAHG
jgi:hypothetical protein